MPRGKRPMVAGMAAALLLMLLMLLLPKDAVYAEDEIDLIEQPSLPVIVFHIDETEGATIDDMHADVKHNTECHGTMDIHAQARGGA